MKYFKKYFSIIAAFLICAFCIVQPAHAAANTDAILSALRSGITVNGQSVKIPANYINQAENFFVSHKITDDQARYILAEINGAKAAIQQAGVTNLKKMDKATKNKVLSAAQAAANNVDLNLTIGSDKKVQIADSNGTVAFTSGNIIKTTGINWNWPLWAAVWSGMFIGIIGICFFLIHKLNLFGADNS